MTTRTLASAGSPERRMPFRTAARAAAALVGIALGTACGPSSDGVAVAPAVGAAPAASVASEASEAPAPPSALPGPARNPSPTMFRFTDLGSPDGATAIDQGVPRLIPEAKGGGVAMFDQDGDGRLDVLVVKGSTVERAARGEPGFGAALYRGNGDGRFKDATAEAGLDVPLPWLMAPVAADFDGDGRTDVLFTALEGLRYFRNEGGRFVDRTGTALPAAVAAAGWCTSAAAADFDGDGDLDVFVARYLAFDPKDPPLDGVGGRTCRHRDRPVLCGPRGLKPLGDLLLKNRGDGTFEEVGSAFGLGGTAPAYGLGVVVLDFDRDGRPDVFVANDATPNHLWRNEGGRFVEVGVGLGVAWSADGAPEAGMGVDAADLNGDGVDDLVVTNFETEPNDVYLSRGDLGWIESSARVRTAGVDRPLVGWGVGIRDFDGDGRLDLFVANGHVYRGFAEGSPWSQPVVLHLGRDDGTFARFRGPEASALDQSRPSRAAAFGDLDDDGDVDVVIVGVGVPPAILRADVPNDLEWYGLRVRGPAPNLAGLGAAVEFEAGGRVRHATVRAQSSFQATNDPRLIFRAPKGGPPPVFRARLGGKVAAIPAVAGAYVDLPVR